MKKGPYPYLWLGVIMFNLHTLYQWLHFLIIMNVIQLTDEEIRKNNDRREQNRLSAVRCRTKSRDYETVLSQVRYWNVPNVNLFPHIYTFWRPCSRRLLIHFIKRRNFSIREIPPFDTMFKLCSIIIT